MSKDTDLKGISDKDFDEMRKKIAIDILLEAKKFVEIDNQVNENLVRMTSSIAKHLEENPELLSNHKNIMELGRVTGDSDQLEGSAFARANFFNPLDTIRKLIEAEKEFIQGLIEKIFKL